MTRFIRSFSIIVAFSYTSAVRCQANAIDLDNATRPVIAGIFSNADGITKLLVRRYTTGGSPDPSFGAQGTVTLDLEGGQSADSVIVGGDGSVTYAGAINNSTNVVYLVSRLLSSGVFSTNFNGDGVVTRLDGEYSRANAHLLLQTGSLVTIAGHVVSNGIVRGGISTFSTTGLPGAIANLTLGDATTIQDVGSPSGPPHKAVVVGYSEQNNDLRGFLAQYNVFFTGISLDPGFGSGGVTQTPAIDSVQYIGLCVDPAGRLIVIGTRNDDQVIERYTATGSVDATFGLTGSLVVPGDLNIILRAVACQADSKVVAAGFNTSNDLQQLAVLRTLSSGTGLDASFGNNDGVFTLLNDTNSFANDLVIDPSGPIYAAGSFDSDIIVLKLSPSGLPDLMFGINGVASTPLSTDNKTTVLRDVRMAGTNGGPFTGVTPTGVTITRTLNTLIGNTDNVALKANRFTVQPGNYLIIANAPASDVMGHQIFLYDVTHDLIITEGTSSFSSFPPMGITESHTLSDLVYPLVVTVETTFEIRHSAEFGNPAPTSLGFAADVGMDEIYTQVTILQLQ